MTDRDAFIASIADGDDDCSKRRIFADWLDDHGEADLAELIRLQYLCRRRRQPKDTIRRIFALKAKLGNSLADEIRRVTDCIQRCVEGFTK